MSKKANFTWITVMEVEDGTVEVFADAIVMKHKDSDITFSITGEAFEFLKDKFNGHV